MSRQQSKLLDWRGQTTVILASGPSLTAEQVEVVRRSNARAIVVNRTWEMLPTADVLYSGDFLFAKVYYAKIKQEFKGVWWTQDRSAAERYGINWVKGVNREGVGTDYIHNNGNSGHQAINLAFLFGSRRILLLGMDMKLGAKGEKHHHPDHPSPCVQSQMFGEWLHKGVKLAAELNAAGCSVVNCAPGSAWRDFPMSDIEKELM